MWSIECAFKRSCYSVCVLLLIFGYPALTRGETKCGHPPVPLNAEVILSAVQLSPSVTATYKCNDGYEIFGNSVIICLPSGRWSGEPPFCATNIGFRKPANQSSTVRGGSALNANDGDRSTEPEGNKCSETQKETNPWWQVDLLKPYSVKVVRVTTRGCCGHQPLQDMEIRVGNSSSHQGNPLCAWFPGTMDEGVTKDFTCARALVGQYVFLQLVGVDGTLSLCEVEIFATDELSVGRCSSNTTPEESQISAFNGTCYEFGVNKGGSFKEAQSSCKKSNGDLIHAMNLATTQFLHTELDRRKPSLKTQLVWIGAQKEPGLSKLWKWVNGAIIHRPAWGLEQPNNYNGEQNCVVLDGGRGWLWNDVGCNLDYLHWVCQYSPAACGNPDKNINTTITGNDFKIGAKVNYKCPEGHMLIGNSERICNINGLWSGNAPTCKYSDCGPLSEIEHGTLTLTHKRTTYGAKAEYTCAKNYTLVGAKDRVCGENEKWSNETPKCLFSLCPDPPEIQGGVVTVQGYQIGDSASYSCQPGHIIIGKSVLTCGLGGQWSGKGPSCKYVDCGVPLNVYNGNYQLINGTTSVDSVVEYTCNEDHWLEGQKIQRCTREGKWSADVPACELITCEEPDVPRGSYVVGYDFNVHSTIEYHCEPGHIMKGESSFTCMSNGKWSGSVPSCEYIDCGKVPPIINGEVEYRNGTTYLNSEVVFSCSKNHKLTGSPRRQCLESKMWSGTLPKCEEIRCPEPMLANHSIISITGNDRVYGRTLVRTADSNAAGTTNYKIGSLVKYRCERGYKTIGEPLRTCEDSGKWSGDVPKCIFVDCHSPDDIINGAVTLTSNATYYGAIALYSCNKNYELKGVSRRLCLENGTWGFESPMCTEIQCKTPDAFEGISVEVSSFGVGGVVQYTCPRGHNMAGNATRICSKSGSWSGRAPVCNPVECEYPNNIENGRVIVMNGTTYNSAIEYHCVPNFKRSGPYLRKCLENAKWSGEEPKCEVAVDEAQEANNLGRNVGIGAGIVIFLLVVLGIIYLKLRKDVPVKNKDNVATAEQKEDRTASVMSYATLSDRNGINGFHAQLTQGEYENIQENMYDAPYDTPSRADSDSYEPEPTGNQSITINGVAVR